MRGTAIAIENIIGAMDKIAPPELALPDDINGVAVGGENCAAAKIREIVLALDATREIVENCARGALIITHHPRLYRSLKSVNGAKNYVSGIVEIALKKRLILFNAHTNLDIAPAGVNDNLAKICGLNSPRIATITHRFPWYKLTVFAPITHAEKVLAAITAAGAGEMGDYRDCGYRSEGYGQFRPNAAAQPFIGERGKLTVVKEIRLETVVKFSAKKPVEIALRNAHPYEEPAFDFVALDRAENFGIGRVGDLPEPPAFADLIARVKAATNCRAAVYYGDLAKKIRTAAVWGGSGVDAENLPPVDALIAGEIDYHRAEILRQKNIALLIIGHYASEFHILPVVRAKLRAAFPGLKISIAKNSDLPANA